MGKKKALADFKNPDFNLEHLAISNSQITIHNNTAVVTGQSTVKGNIGENVLTGSYHFMRVWSRRTDDWQIIAVSTIEAVQDMYEQK